MKATKLISTIITLLCIGILPVACKNKDKARRAFYLQQNRDPKVVGKYLLVKTDTINKQFFEFTAKGERLSTYMRNGKTYTDRPNYWYTSNDNTIHILYYIEDWDKGSFESSFPYNWSALKDTLYLGVGQAGQSTFIRQ